MDCLPTTVAVAPSVGIVYLPMHLSPGPAAEKIVTVYSEFQAVGRSTEAV